MSEEPRLRFEDNDTVVSEVWYEQSTGETVIETQSGEQYRFNDGGVFDTPGVNTGSLSHTPSENVPQSVSANTQQGHAVAWLYTGDQKSVDFTEYASDEVALQELVDYIESAGDDGGTVYIPTAKADGTNVSIGGTVSTDSSLRVPVSLIQVEGSDYQGTGERARLESTITDGSPMFEINGDIPNQFALQGIRVKLKNVNTQNNDCTVLKCRQIINSNIEMRIVRGLVGTAIQLDAVTDGMRINNTYVGGNSESSARAIAFTNTAGVSNEGSDTVIGPFFKTDGNFDTCIYNNGHTRMRIAGASIEGGDGTANIHNAAGSMTVGETTKVGDNASGGHGVLHEGYFFTVNGAFFNLIDGDAIRVDGGTRINISPTTRFNGITGDAINCVTTPDGIVPYENTISEGVTYPTGVWDNLYYPDGWQMYHESSGSGGTVTVPAGGTATLNSFAGRPETEIDWKWWVATDPGSDVELVERRGFNTSNGQNTLILEETTANSSVDVNWVLLRRGNQQNLN